MTATLFAETDLDVVVDHRLLGIVDAKLRTGQRPPSPHSVGRWFTTTPGSLYIESVGDVIDARLRLEAWDGPPPFDTANWDRYDVTQMELASGVLDVDMLAAGGLSGVFELPHQGVWHARVAWRESVVDDPAAIDDLDDPEDGEQEPEAWAMLQFWPTADP